MLQKTHDVLYSSGVCGKPVKSLFAQVYLSVNKQVQINPPEFHQLDKAARHKIIRLSLLTFKSVYLCPFIFPLRFHRRVFHLI